jgi:toxin ParE1/3/4
MAYEVSIVARAARDLAELYDKIDAEHEPAARKWYLGLKTALLTLENHPYRRISLRSGGKLRALFYGRRPHVYSVIYRILEKQKQIEILHIRHGARKKIKAADSF